MFTSALLLMALSKGQVSAANNRSRFPLPSLRVPDSLGVQFHVQLGDPDELDEIAQRGFRWVRTDVFWHVVEPKRGRWNFRMLDPFVQAADRNKLRLMLSLDYGNPEYEAADLPESIRYNVGPTTPPAQQAFVRFAVETVRRYQGRGILWEIWNEPNHPPFWSPKPNPSAYARLAVLTSRAIRRAFPGEYIVGPAAADVDIPFMERVFREGALNYWDAVTVHAYRGRRPETALEPYRAAQALIARYAPAGKRIPLLCGEWGYSTISPPYRPQPPISRAKQADYYTRIYLTSLMAGMPLTILYNWRAQPGAPNAYQRELSLQTEEGRPKEAMNAVASLIRRLRGFTYERRLPTASGSDFILTFRNGARRRYVVWTARPDPVVEPRPGDTRSETARMMAKIPNGPQLIMTTRPTVYEASGAAVQ
jgi:hypothetical protein